METISASIEQCTGGPSQHSETKTTAKDIKEEIDSQQYHYLKEITVLPCSLQHYSQ